LQGGAVLDSGENMHFIVSRVKAIKSKSEESESHGWVKLEFYDNKGEGETDWLPILSETASNGCGFWSLPETGVQALACIFDGTKSGFVIGFLYDEKHKPPVKENEKACDRTILQTKNHRFELVDEEGKETISISTSKGKMRVVLASDGGIEIANKMKKGKIEIEAEELEIESENLIFDEYSTSIEAGVLEITNSNSVSLNTKKDFKVKGKNVKLNGSTGVTAKGKQIAKQDDKVVGLDTHNILVTTPGGTVPTPFPHPFVGALKEDLAASVKIWNNKVATKNSVAKHLAGHVPMGPGPFQKTPDNKGKVTGGTEKSVKANGKEVAVIGSSVTTCNDIGARNNSKILAAGMAVNMPAIADPMKSEAYERERKTVEEEKTEEKKVRVYEATTEDFDICMERKEIERVIVDIRNNNNLADERVIVYVQPIFDVIHNNYRNAEALMRLDVHGKIVYPDVFIPLAEKVGCIHTLTRIILNKVSRKIYEIQDYYNFDAVSVNVSLSEFMDYCLHDELIEIIKRNGISCDKIRLEMTESMTSAEVDAIRHNMQEFNAAGVHFYLDDFGTGYSNLERIVSLPFKTIKFDKSLLYKSVDDPILMQLIKNMVDVFKSHGLIVLIEGVENDNQAELSIKLGFEFIQGFNYAHPVPISELENFFETKQRRLA